MLSGAVLMTLILPLQIAYNPGGTGKFAPFFVAGAFADSARIIGIPRFRLRDSSGNPYLPDKALRQEPLATIYAQANFVVSELEAASRKRYIQSYVRR